MADRKNNWMTALSLSGIPFAALCLVGGAVLAFWPGESLNIFYYAVTALLILLGLARLPGVFRAPGASEQRGKLAVAGVLVAAGLLLIFRPMAEDPLFQNLLALIALALGLRRIQCALGLWKDVRPLAGASIVIGALEAAAGVWLLAKLYEPPVTLRILGIVMLVECVLELVSWIVTRVRARSIARAARRAEKAEQAAKAEKADAPAPAENN